MLRDCGLRYALAKSQERPFFFFTFAIKYKNDGVKTNVPKKSDYDDRTNASTPSSPVPYKNQNYNQRRPKQEGAGVHGGKAVNAKLAVYLLYVASSSRAVRIQFDLNRVVAVLKFLNSRATVHAGPAAVGERRVTDKERFRFVGGDFSVRPKLTAFHHLVELPQGDTR